jgi:tight adherence protein C
MILPFLSAMFVFLAIASLAVWRLQMSTSGLDPRIRALASERDASLSLREVPFERRVVLPVIDSITQRVIELLPPTFIARTRKHLVAAGEPMSLVGFFTFVLFLAALFPVAYYVIAWGAIRGSPSGAILVFLPLVALLGVLLPFLWLRRTMKRRQTLVWRGLPDAFDLMTTCVEAGLGLDSAFQKVCEKMEGPVAVEFSEMLREVSMGKSRRDALRDMGDRTGVADLQAFANMIIQAEELGTSLGTTLRAQAADMRRRRRQRAEEEARRAPAKMVFPLVFFILPSLFVVILGPIAIELFKVFGE